MVTGASHNLTPFGQPGQPDQHVRGGTKTMLDLLITGGTVIDGTGNPGFRATVAIESNRVRILHGNGELPPAAATIDATGLIVAPGFIDMHSHSALVIFDDPAHLPKLFQGVTTEVIGVDGNSYAPFADREELRRFVTVNAGLEGRPNLPYDWDSFDSYISMFEGASPVNIACLVGSSTLRIGAVGWNDVPADDKSVAVMRSLLREALEDGAFGLSSGLDYPPGSYASTAELAELCKEPARVGALYHTHVRYWLGDKYLDPFREAFEITKPVGCPLHITHLYCRASYPRGSEAMFALINSEIASGTDVTFDGYPYEWGSTRLTVFLPQWIQQGGPGDTVARLSDPQCRERFKKELAETGQADSWRTNQRWVKVGYFARRKNLIYEGLTMGTIAQQRGQDVADTLFDLLVEEDLRLTEVHPGPTGTTLAKFFQHSHSMVGSDSVFVGDSPSPRTYGSFPRILGEFVREESFLSLPDAIRKFTSFPAQRLGLPNRGILRDGYVADITIFDADRVQAVATYDRPRELSVGIEYVIVNGTVALDRGTPTGARPGRALRRRR
jgi:N-acyl-D-amino-acid deacylase